MENQVLTVEQMQELEALGIDISKASIFWIVNVKNEKGKEKDLIPPFLSFHKTTQKVGMQCFECIPTFTLQDILEMLPRTINYDGSKRLRVLPPNEIEYTNYSLEGHFKHGDSLLEAAFNMLKWCKQKNYI